MASVPSPVHYQERDHPMTKTKKSLTSVANQPSRVPARVRVKLQAYQRGPREGLSPGRREQGLVDSAEASSRHQIERFCQRLTDPVAGRRSVAMQWDFRNRLECRACHD
jgi:hypothetical protein